MSLNRENEGSKEGLRELGMGIRVWEAMKD